MKRETEKQREAKKHREKAREIGNKCRQKKIRMVSIEPKTSSSLIQGSTACATRLLKRWNEREMMDQKLHTAPKTSEIRHKISNFKHNFLENGARQAAEFLRA